MRHRVTLPRHRFGYLPMILLLWPAVLYAAAAASDRTGEGRPRPNVLFLAVDDLRPELGCYGVEEIISPNIDCLAKRGVVFNRAYCQQAVCNPSRVSLLTGLRPDSAKVWDLVTDFRDTVPDVVTLPQHFKQNGYYAVGMGKIFHNTFPDPASWTIPKQPAPSGYTWYSREVRERLRREREAARQAGMSEREIGNRIRGPATDVEDVPDNHRFDGALGDLALEHLRKAAAQQKPFFLAVGFILPHLPWTPPKKYWDLYDPAEIPMAANDFLPKGMPAVAFGDRSMGGMYELMDCMDFKDAPSPFEGSLTEAQRRRLKHGYYASVSFVDAQIGRLMAELDRLGLQENTMVVLWGDHGWKLGEHNGWCKQTNYEVDTRSPLMIAAPGAKANGKPCNALVEFLDIYPTLCELAGLPLPDHLEGKSMAPLLDEPDQPWKMAAFSQFPRRHHGRDYMGYTMRTDQYRYVEWIDRQSGLTTATELYDHQSDPQENVNIANLSGNEKLVRQLRRRLWENIPRPAPRRNPADAAGQPVDFHVTPPPPELKLDPFYQKFISADGYPIVASGNVSDFALKEAAYLVHMMLAKRPDVRDAMIKSGSRMCIIGYDEFTTDLPEFARLSPKDYWDARARGTGGSRTDPYCSCGEENLLGYPGDPYGAECILIHEFAHNIHLRGMVNIDPTFDERLKKTYEQAMAKGLWKGKYASVNYCEYFAEGVQSWFDNNRPPDFDHNYVNTRRELIQYDPGLAAICREVFGNTELVYTKPATRLRGHLAGYVPSQAPTFVWPERLKGERAEILRKAQRRGQQNVAGDPSDAQTQKKLGKQLESALTASEGPRVAAAATSRQTRVIAGWTVHVSKELLARDAAATARALELLESQLDEIARVVPKAAVAELRKVPLWISPEYPGVNPRAEYHPDAGWLREHGRDPAMAKGVEFTNVRIFEAETRRMPNFALHELAHAYHDRVLPGGFANPEIRAAFEKANASGKYDRVEQRLGDGRTAEVRAYALSSPQEYFAESTEAFFSRNDFYPFTREQLKAHDPEMYELLERLWNRSE